PRSEYAPAYALTLLPGAGQLAVFPCGDRFVLVGAHRLPEDITRHAAHGHAGRGAIPGREDLPTEAGLFLILVGDHDAVVGVRSRGRERGGLHLEAPAGQW